jgi:hypothetical protein
MRRIMPSRLSPALVVSVLALVAALAGSAVAEVATTARLDKKEKKQVKKIVNKQLSKQLKQNPVEEQQIADGAVTNDQLANPIYSAVVAADGTLARGVGATSSERLATGLFVTRFDRDLSGCSWVAQIGAPAGVPVASGEISTSLRSPADSEALLHIVNGSNGVVADKPFHVLVYC